MKILASLLFMCMYVPVCCSAQSDPLSGKGISPYGSYDFSGIGAVNMENGNLSIDIPLLSFKQAGNLPDLEIHFVSDSTTWQEVQTSGNLTFLPGLTPSGSPTASRLINNLQGSYELEPITYDAGPSTYSLDNYVYYFGLRDWRGALHLMAPASSGGATVETIDGSGLSVGAGVLDRKGNYYRLSSPAGPIASDLFGNTITPSGTANAPSVTDSIGRVLPARISPSSPGCRTTTFPGPQPVGTQTLTVCSTNHYVETHFLSEYPPRSFGYYANEYQGFSLLIDSISLPNGKQWTFTYNSYGDIASINMPTGGSSSFAWKSYLLPSSGANTNSGSAAFGRQISSKTMSDNNGTSATWLYTGTYPYITITDPAGNDTVHTSNSQYPLSIEVDHYAGPAPTSVVSGGVCAGFPSAPNLIRTDLQERVPVDSMVNSTQTPDLIATNTWTYYPTGQMGGRRVSYDWSRSYVDNQYENVDQPDMTFPFTTGSIVESDDYDYGHCGPGALLKQTLTTFQWQGSDSRYMTSNVIDATASETVKDVFGHILAASSTQYDEPAYVNAASLFAVPTTTTRGLGTEQTSEHAYYSAGSSHAGTNPSGTVYKAIDGRGFATQYTYQCNGVAPLTMTNPLKQVTSYVYDCGSNLLASTTDPNGQATTYWYTSVGNLSLIVYPDGGSTSVDYHNYNVPLTVTTTQTTAPGSFVTSSILYDGLGRAVTATAPNGAVVDTVYDALGNVVSVSNPHVSLPSQTDGLSLFAYDPVGRKLKQTNPDNSTKRWSYSGDMKVSFDEAGNAQRHYTDALGRLVQVTEGAYVSPDGLSCSACTMGDIHTSYTYDALGSLKTVTQSGNRITLVSLSSGTQTSETPRVRSFSYDSLARLVTATNPETGTVCYGTVSNGACINGYDANGNLQAKTDARGVTTSYIYDALNRLTGKAYSDGTASTHYDYDQFGSWNGVPRSNLVGRLAHIAVGAGTSQWDEQIYSYDPLGRMIQVLDATPSEAGMTFHTTTAAYDLVGNLTDLTYPDTRHVNQAWDTAGRLKSIGDGSQTQTYVQSVTYNPDGSPQVLTLGNGVQQTTTENNRLQVQSVNVSSPLPPTSNQPFLSHSYCRSTADCSGAGSAYNNGNIWQIADNLNPVHTQAFAYDALNRIKSFSLNGQVTQQYSIDSFGNMSLAPNGSATTAFDPATNRIANLPCGSVTTAYDAAGNQLCDNDPYGGVRHYTFNAESQISAISSLNSSTPFVTYTQGADGNRVRKTNADGTWTEYAYFNGQPIAEKSQTGAWTDYIYANDKKIAKTVQQIPLWHMHFDRTSVPHLEWGVEGRVYGTPATLAGTPLVSGDKLVLDFKQVGVPGYGGVALIFTDGSGAGDLVDETTGTQLWVNNVADGNWHHLAAALDGYAGRSVAYAYAGIHNSMPAGINDTWIAYMAIVHLDGTIVPLFTGQQTLSVGWSNYGAANAMYSGTDTVPADAAAATNYYVADHLGTNQMEFTQGGWPIWRGEFAPFGQELDTQNTGMHYKFTGKERDAESGLDYFGARYYGSNMGRFMSPDDGSDQNALNPQSWNLYSYGRNNPLIGTDDDGRTYKVCDSNGQNCSNIDDKTFESEQAKDQANGVNYSNGSITDSSGAKQGTYSHDPDIAGDPAANIAAMGNIGNQGMGAIHFFGEQMVYNALGGVAAHGIGLGVEALLAARAARIATAAEVAIDAEKIANGHAFAKHAAEFGNATQSEFKGLVQETMANPSDVRNLSNGRTAFWSDSQQMVVIKNPGAVDGGTAFRPTAGKAYFNNLR